MKRWRRAVTALAVVHLTALVGFVLLLRFVGERWWVTGIALFLPRAPWLVPIAPFLAVAIRLRDRRLFALELVALFVGLFPLMGFVVGLPKLGRSKDTIRVMTFNVNSCFSGVDAIAKEIVSKSPDVVFVEELFLHGPELAKALEPHFREVSVSTQFLVASRFPIVATRNPERVSYYARARSPRFMQYEIETPIGRVAFYNVHPLSPRDAFYALRGHGLRREIGSGRLFTGEHADVMKANSGLRMLQVRTISELARSGSLPTIVLGDTNLPGLHPALSNELGGYHDGFEKVGFGFGYTYPAKLPWMRLDRILASDALTFTDFEVDCRGVSDHLCVVANLARK
jgi:endonuclease/exonuclease/phosphatase family metal-dependent hydrolase